MPTIGRFLWHLHLPLPTVPEPKSGSDSLRTQPGLQFLLLCSASVVFPVQHSLLFRLPETVCLVPRPAEGMDGLSQTRSLHLMTTVQKKSLTDIKAQMAANWDQFFHGTSSTVKTNQPCCPTGPFEMRSDKLQCMLGVVVLREYSNGRVTAEH